MSSRDPQEICLLNLQLEAKRTQINKRVESKSSKVIITFLYEHISGLVLDFSTSAASAEFRLFYDDYDLTPAISLRNCDRGSFNKKVSSSSQISDSLMKKAIR